MTTGTFASRLRASVTLGTIIVATVLLSGCSALDSIIASDPERDPETQEVNEAGTADVFSLRVGDCYNDEGSTDEEISSVPAVPCSEPHDNEAYFAFDIADGDFPGDESILASADEGCFTEFEPFVGFSYEESELDFGYIFPTEASWADGDREILCTIYAVDLTQVTGSLAGAAR